MIGEVILRTVVKVMAEKGWNWMTSKFEKEPRRIGEEHSMICISTDIERAKRACLKDPLSPDEGAPPAR